VHRSSIYWFTTLALILGVPASGLSADIDEFKVKRQEVYEFTEKPTVTRDGDKVTITFASKGFCDATVAVEDATGKIIRHLASGVLGAKVPEPFQKDSLSQTLVWDGKNDQGVHVDNKDSLTVRVSLGLKPQFERTFFWSPKKRIAPGNRPIVCPRPEGVYVFEGGGVDHIRLFDHEGNYVRTIWPPPSDKLAKVDGLKWAEFPQDGQRLPLWNGLVQATLLTSGNNTGDNTLAKYGCAASTMAIHDGQMALVMRSLNRLTPDGTTGGMKLEGAKVFRDVTAGGSGGSQEAYPRSAVFSPDGKTLYMSGYGWSRGYPAGYDWLHCVTRMDFAAAASPELFLGSLKERDAGNDNAHFRCPCSATRRR